MSCRLPTVGNEYWQCRLAKALLIVQVAGNNGLTPEPSTLGENVSGSSATELKAPATTSCLLI
jgi:hypothetical protein